MVSNCGRSDHENTKGADSPGLIRFVFLTFRDLSSRPPLDINLRNEYIEFSIQSPERFAALQRVFAELKHDKDAENWRATEELLKYFDADSLRHFYWPPQDERIQRLWQLKNRPIAITPTEQVTGAIWDFDSLMDAFINGEYNLLSCELIGGRFARLNFYALAYPYGGVGCMVALIEAFGGVVTAIDDGAEPVRFISPKS